MTDDASSASFRGRRVLDRPRRAAVGRNGGYYRLDSYNPQTGEIVSRKLTQFAEIDRRTALQYINELARKYPPGTIIADVPSSGPLAGQALRGRMILEVPVQTAPIPQSVIDAANRRGILIRDIDGRIYNP